MITEKVLRAAGASASNAVLYAPLLQAACEAPEDSFNKITSRNGQAMVVAQSAIESMFFKRTQEDLTYSVKALKGLIGVDQRTGRQFRYFTDEQAEAYGYVDQGKKRVQQPNQRMIANLYYGGRLGNLGTHTDDGWTFKGLTLIQLTGRYNITRWAKSNNMSVEEALEWGKTPEGAVNGLLWYWRNHGLLVPASRGDVPTCTRLIQGGAAHLKERTEIFDRVLPLI